MSEDDVGMQSGEIGLVCSQITVVKNKSDVIQHWRVSRNYVATCGRVIFPVEKYVEDG